MNFRDVFNHVREKLNEGANLEESKFPDYDADSSIKELKDAYNKIDKMFPKLSPEDKNKATDIMDEIQQLIDQKERDVENESKEPKIKHWKCECGHKANTSSVYDEKICPKCHKDMIVESEVSEDIEFLDGMKFNTNGPLHIEKKKDGLYVVGKGILAAVETEEEGKSLISRIESENESKVNEDEYYNIVRFHKDGRKRVVQRHVTKEEAQSHCKDPSTKKEGEWFDGYVNEQKKYETSDQGKAHFESLIAKQKDKKVKAEIELKKFKESNDKEGIERIEGEINEIDYKIKRLDEKDLNKRAFNLIQKAKVALTNKATTVKQLNDLADEMYDLSTNTSEEIISGELEDKLDSWSDKLYDKAEELGKTKESKINEDELGAGGSTRANDPNLAAPDPVVDPEPELNKEEPVKEVPEEKPAEELPPEGEKEYLGNKGSDEYYYFVIVPSEDGTKDLQIQDASDEIVYSAKENQIETSNTKDFLWKGIQELQLSNIAIEIIDKYLIPEEKPEDIEKEEGMAETGEEQTQSVETEEPKESGVIPELGAPAFKSHMGESTMIERLMQKYALTEDAKPLIERLLEKYKLTENIISKLLEKFGLNIHEAIINGRRIIEQGEEEIFKAPPAPKDVEDLEKPVVGEHPGPADANVPEPGLNEPVTEPGKEGEPLGVEPKAEDLSNPESARADLQMRYPEEPFTTTALSYADSLIDDPKVYGSLRNLHWQGNYANAETFIKQVKIVGNYNEFNPDIAQRLIDAVGEGSKFRLAREGSVAVYVTIRDLDKRISLGAVKDLIRADEIDQTGNPGEFRAWWD
jgi:hypothetical protein